MGLFATVDLQAATERAQNLVDSVCENFAMSLLSAAIEVGEELLASKEDEEEDGGRGGKKKEEEEIEIDDVDFETPVIDASPILEAFMTNFMTSINILCPVDTGYLLSTCHVTGGGYTAYCEAGAEYAQYVEYGTSRMSAQPYFEPSIEEGIIAAREVAAFYADNVCTQLSETMWQAGMAAIGSISIQDLLLIILIAILLAILAALIEELISPLRFELEEVFLDAFADITISS